MWQYLDSLNIKRAAVLIFKESRYCHITTLGPKGLREQEKYPMRGATLKSN